MSTGEFLIVTERQLREGWVSSHRDHCDAVPSIQQHHFEVIEGPRPDRTYLVKAPGFYGVPEVETQILGCVAAVLNLEEKRRGHPDPRRRKVAAAWVPVCESAFCGNPADRTAVLERYVELVGAGAIARIP